MENTLVIHEIVGESLINGPGTRSVIWVQGCCFNCPGCENQEARRWNGGTPMSVEAVIDSLPLDEIEGITVSGGEPFTQAGQLSLLAGRMQALGKSVMVYSGFTLEQLCACHEPDIDQLLFNLDILIDSPFLNHIPPSTIWAGSGNQRIHFLTGRYRHLEKEICTPIRNSELHIGADGTILLTGFNIPVITRQTEEY